MCHCNVLARGVTLIEETNRFPWMKVSTETNAELKRGSKIEGVKLPPLFKGAAKYPTSDCVGSRIKKWEEEITQNFCGEVHCALMGSRFSGRVRCAGGSCTPLLEPALKCTG